MVSGPSSNFSAAFNSTPTINFRPDPGEPAVRLSAREQETAGLVTLQEQRNETRLRSRAIARGDDFIYSNRTFDLQVGQSSPVFSGGLTTVLTRSDPNGSAPDNRFIPTQDNSSLAIQSHDEASETDSEQSTEEENPLEPQSLEEANEQTEEELDAELQNLETEDSRLERNLNQARLEQELALETGNGPQIEAAAREEQQLEREQEEIEQEQRELELEKLAKQLEETLMQANQAITDNLAAAIGTLDVLFGLGNQTNEEEPLLPQSPPLRPFNNTFFATSR